MKNTKFCFYLISLAIIYWILARVVLHYFSNAGNVTLVWFPGGLGLSILLIGGIKYWPCIIIGAFSAGISVNDPLLVALIISVGNTLESLTGFLLLTRFFDFDIKLSSSRDYLRLSFTGLVCSWVSALIGPSVLLISDLISPQSFILNIISWWQGDVLGILLVTPLILVWQKIPFEWLSRTRLAESICCFGFAFLFGQVIFLDWFSSFFHNRPSGYWMFPFVIWAAIRFDCRGALLVISMTAVQALLGINNNVGIFSIAFIQANLFNFWLYIFTLTLVGILLSLIITEREQISKALLESEERWKFALEGAGDGVWDWDIKNNHVYLSNRWKEMFGYDSNEKEKPFEEWKKCFHPEDVQSFMDEIQSCVNQNKSHLISEHRIKCKDGSWKWSLARGMSIHGKGNQPQRIIGTHSDISKQKRDAELLQEAKDAAEKANVAKSEFVSRMSHELRTPLNAIMGFSQLLNTAEITDDQHENVREILFASHHLLELIDDILDISKIESGQFKLTIEPLKLSPLLDHSISLLEPLAEENSITVIDNISSGPEYYIKADMLRLNQVFINLLSNAIKYNRPDGTVTLNNEVSIPGFLKITFTDTGNGINQEQLKMLFKPFERLGKENSEIQGTGIGLNVTKKLIEAMDGNITVSSKVGEGSIFSIELPMVEYN